MYNTHAGKNTVQTRCKNVQFCNCINELFHKEVDNALRHQYFVALTKRTPGPRTIDPWRLRRQTKVHGIQVIITPLVVQSSCSNYSSSRHEVASGSSNLLELRTIDTGINHASAVNQAKSSQMHPRKHMFGENMLCSSTLLAVTVKRAKKHEVAYLCIDEK